MEYADPARLADGGGPRAAPLEFVPPEIMLLPPDPADWFTDRASWAQWAWAWARFSRAGVPPTAMSDSGVCTGGGGPLPLGV